MFIYTKKYKNQGLEKTRETCPLVISYIQIIRDYSVILPALNFLPITLNTKSEAESDLT